MRKGIRKNAAMCITRKLCKLAEYMQYGYAIIAYYKQDETFQLVTATLASYAKEFNRPYNVLQIQGILPTGMWKAKDGELSKSRTSWNGNR